MSSESMKHLLLLLVLLLAVSFVHADEKLFANGEKLIFPKVTNNGLMSSVVIITKNKHAIVYDGGHAADCDHLVEVVKKYTDTVDYWFLTHAHNDHVEALIELFKKNPVPLKVKNILYSFPSLEWFSQSDEWTDEVRSMVGGIKALPVPHTEIHKGDVIELDGVKIEVLNDYDPKFKRDACNNSSITSMVTMSGKRILVPGDIGLEMSLKLIEEQGDNLKADIVVMVHHGQGGAQKNFYEKVMPTIAVWTTPTWVWENDNGSGPGSHCLTTNYTKCWMQELNVKRQYRNVNDVILQ
ncbi:MAG: MBL fold metallo-hydrolase [Lentisphaeria bacterium]|nr:MBL fold metallo-hydrolase [Lentisphaeria bacterium]